LAVGEYTARLKTLWGTSPQSIKLTILPTSKIPRHTDVVILDVDKHFNRDFSAALKAAALLAKNHSAGAPSAEVVLGSGVYNVQEQLMVPNRTTVRGVSSTATTLSVVLHTAPPVQGTCSKPILNVDFTNNNCNGTRVWGEHCFKDTNAVTATTMDECCDQCKSSLVAPGCNAYTFFPDLKACVLKNCDDGATCWRTSNSSAQSGWLNGGCSGQPATACAGPVGGAALKVGSEVTLVNFGMNILPETTVPGVVGVWSPDGNVKFISSGLRITMLQDNVSSAYRLDGTSGFDLQNNTVVQAGKCLGGTGDSSPFEASVAVYIHRSSTGRFARNVIEWQCSAFDFDTTDYVVFEENEIHCTNKGLLPHGSSISGYDWGGKPSSRFWSVARNVMTRIPFVPGTEANWKQRETMTTDGSGGFATGVLVATPSPLLHIHLKWTVWSAPPVKGATLLVLYGPGAGSSRVITNVIANGTLEVRCSGFRQDSVLEDNIRCCWLEVSIREIQ
jgi:hypothetical protein